MTKLHDEVLNSGYLTTPYQFYNTYTVELYGNVIVCEFVNSFLKSRDLFKYIIQVFA